MYTNNLITKSVNKATLVKIKRCMTSNCELDPCSNDPEVNRIHSICRSWPTFLLSVKAVIR